MFGVKTYVPLVVLSMVGGFQEPMTPLGEVFDNIGAAVPLQKAGIAAKSGTICGVTVTVKVWVVAH